MKHRAWKMERNYLRAEMRRGFALLPSFGLSVLLAGAAVLIAAVLFCAFSEEHQLFPKANIAIVMEQPDFKTAAAVKLVESMESVSSICSFTLPDKSTAEQQLADGQIAGIIYLGADAYQDINTGVNTPIEIRLSSAASSLNRDTFSSLVSAGVSLIRTTEAAVYAGGSLPGNGQEDGAKITEDDIFEVYLKYILNRTSLFTTKTGSPLGELTLRQFYLGSALLLILLLFGIGFTGFYTEEEETVTDLLSRDVPFPALDGARLLTEFVLLLVTGAALGAVLLLVPAFNPAAAGLSAGGRLLLWVKALPALSACLFSMAAFWHFLYLVLPNEGAGLVSLLITVLLFAFSGGLVPEVYMPPVCRALAAISPVRLWQGCLFDALSGRSSPASAAPALLAGLLLLGAACLYRLCTRSRLDRRYL